jgi:hypothetical protein
MIRVFHFITALAIGCALSAAASAATCTMSNTPGAWTFATLGSCGSGTSGVSFTQNGETITIFPEELKNGAVQSSGGSNPVNGLFEVQKGQNGNLASGIGPFDTNQGGSPFTGQLGVADYNSSGQDYTGTGTRYDNMLYIEISQTGAGAIAAGSTLKFLMQEGDQADSFNVYTGTFAAGTTTPPNLSSMTQVVSDMSVGALNGGATTPQFSIVTSTTSANPIEFIAIQADCKYLLLNSISASAPSVPEPRFYGLLLAGLLGLIGMRYQKRRAAQATA